MIWVQLDVSLEARIMMRRRYPSVLSMVCEVVLASLVISRGTLAVQQPLISRLKVIANFQVSYSIALVVADNRLDKSSIL